MLEKKVEHRGDAGNVQDIYCHMRTPHFFSQDRYRTRIVFCLFARIFIIRGHILLSDISIYHMSLVFLFVSEIIGTR